MLARTIHHLSAVAVGLAIIVASGTAQAQYYGQQQPAPQQRNESLNIAGRGEIALNLAGSLGFGIADPEDSDATSTVNVYFAPALVGGLMLTNFFELRLSLGLQYVAQDVSGANNLENLAFVGTLQGLFQGDLIPEVAIYGGVGLGGFGGSRSESVGAGLSRTYTSGGGIGQLLVGLLILPDPWLLFRGGIRADFIFGWDDPSDAAGVGVFFFTTQILFEVSVGVRFG